MQLITQAQVREAALKYAQSRKVNPVDSCGACVYSTKSGKRHCIAAQIAVDLGGQAPKYDDRFDLNDHRFQYFRSVTGLQFTDYALRLLGRLQREADSNLKPWNKVINYVIKGM